MGTAVLIVGKSRDICPDSGGWIGIGGVDTLAQGK